MKNTKNQEILGMTESLLFCNSIEYGIRKCFGTDISVEGRTPVGGGDINRAYALRLSNGETVFMKANTAVNKDFFKAEAGGLNAIASTGAIKTPKLYFRGVDEDEGVSFLVMEYISGVSKNAAFWTNFGRNLAAMHMADTKAFASSGRYGFAHDNFIGATEQINIPKDSWIEFFRSCRLEPQFIMAERYFDYDDRVKIRRLLDKLHGLLSEPERPSLLHGDLWAGNYIVGNDGEAWLIDPAAYVGHAEADLAMTELFGGFPQEFYRAYSDVKPISSDYKDRKDLYNLYHLLNHLNLFGTTYLGAVMSTVRHYA